jgi:hypothetical protein
MGCGDDEEATTVPEPVPGVSTESVQGGLDDVPVDEAECRAFCEKANECARAEGRQVPEAAADCAVSCRPGGVHRRAPAAIHACARQACGPAFVECSQRAMIAHMRDREVAVFPPLCEGLCEKAAWCARHGGGQPLGPGEDDCEAACEAGGAYAETSNEEHLCVHQQCGPDFVACRTAAADNRP